MNHEVFLKRTFELAHWAAYKGNHPFGAILVLNDEIIAEAENAVVSEHDSTQHAELRLVSLACKTTTENKLGHAVIYSSTEPCAMCSGAIYWSGIRRIVFGCSAMRLKAHANATFAIDCRDLFQHAQERVLIEGPFLEDEAASVHESYWPQQRQNVQYNG